VSPLRDRNLRGAAVAFLAAALPLAVAIALAGGLVALAPLVLLLLPVLVTGRAAGVDALGRLATRRTPRRPARAGLAPAGPSPRRVAVGGLLIASSLAKRGPPLAA